MAISESDITAINNARDSFHGIKLLIPSQEKMRAVLDKETTAAAAAKVGIQVPRTLRIDQLSSLDPAKVEIRFPVILKWADPNAVAAKLSAVGMAVEKARYCHNWTELHERLQRYSAIGSYPLIQEYCPGYGLGQFLFLDRGKVLLSFQHRRINEWPPEGGFSSLCESLSAEVHGETMAKSIALLRSLNWQGAAMVEYRFDPETHAARLMEVNGRFWGSLPLAYHCGARFALLTYSVLGNEEALAGRAPRSGIRCRFVIPDAKRLLRIVFQPSQIADRTLRFNRLRELVRFVTEFLNPRTRYYVFSLRDPKPFFADIIGSGMRVLSRRR